MSKKYLLKFGLPTLGVLIIIVAVALFAGRDKPSPIVSNPNETVLEYKTLKISKKDLYERMKSNYALHAILEELDLFLLKDFEEKIDQDKVYEDIEKDKEDDEEAFYDQFAKLGVFQKDGETKDELDKRIYGLYKLEYMKEEYARTQVEIKTEDIDKRFNDYKEDVCVIPLSFPNKKSSDDFYKELEGKSNEEIVQAFKDKYTEQLEENKKDDDDEEEVEEPDYIDEAFECDFERIIYKDTSVALRNLIYNDLTAYKDLDAGTALAGKAYNSTYRVISGKYHVVLKMAVANAKGNYEEKLRNLFKEELIEQQLTSSFISKKITELREDKGLKIFDPEIANQYKETISEKYKVYKKMKRGAQIIAEIEGKIITADELYDDLKATYGVTTMLDRVNFQLLGNFEGIQLTKKEKESVDKAIKEMKQQFLASGYGQYFTWKEYMGLMFKVTTEAELKESYAFQSYLVDRFILGHEDWKGSNPVTNDDVLLKFDYWLEAADGKAYRSITANHILFKFDDFDEDGKPTEEAKERARKLADQVINGVNDNNRLEDDKDGKNQNIMFTYDKDADEDETVEPTEFKGLYDLDPNYSFNSVFNKIAKEYSEDPGSAGQNGSLGSFGPTEFSQDQQTGQNIPKRMVKPFELAALATAEGDWTSEAVETDFGFHIIFVTKKTLAPEQPKDYLSLTDEQIKERIEDKEPLYSDYHNFFTTLKNQVIDERLSGPSVNRELALLRDEENFKFTDDVFQNHYLALQEIYKREKVEEDN